MIPTLNPDMLHLSLKGEPFLALAKKHGFDAIDAPADTLGGEDPSKAVALLAAKNLRRLSGGLGLGRLTAGEEEWKKGLDGLAKRAAAAKTTGSSRTTTVMLPFHEEDSFARAFEISVRRLRQADDALRPFEIRIGVEYVSQPSRRAVSRKPFLHSLDGTLALLHAVDRPGVGLLLDSFHWHCAGETVKDVEALRPDRIVMVHLADAPDRPLAEQVAFERLLPGEGVADLRGFCDALRSIGYAGPVVCEPFQSSFKELPHEEVLSKVAASFLPFLAH